MDRRSRVNLRFWFSAVFFFYLVYGLLISRYNPSVLPVGLNPPKGKYFDYRGITHVHSNESTGSASPQEIIATAASLNIDFLIFTDLNIFQFQDELEGYHDKLLAMSAAEYSYSDTHLLYYGARVSKDFSGAGQIQMFFSDLLSRTSREARDGIIVIPHPFGRRNSWSGEIPESIDGLEVINLKSVLEKKSSGYPVSVAWSFFLYPFNSQLSLLRLYQEPSDEIHLWDRTAARQKIMGYAGTDATAKAVIFPNWTVRFPSYETLFSLVSNHVLLNSEMTGNAFRDEKNLLQALKNGHFYMSLDILGDSKGFFAEMRSESSVYPMGSTVKFEPNLKLFAALPQQPTVPFEINLFKNGELYTTVNTPMTSFNILTPGVYRVSVRVLQALPLPDGRKWFTWIYSNPFFVR